MFVDIVKAFIL